MSKTRLISAKVVFKCHEGYNLLQTFGNKQEKKKKKKKNNTRRKTCFI